MTPTIASSSAVARRAPAGHPETGITRSKRLEKATPTSAHGDPRSPGGARLHTTRARHRLDPLGRYIDAMGRARDVIATDRGDGCVLVVDRDTLTLGDRRLVARLEAEEPIENAALMCAHYLKDTSRGRCRRVNVEDLAGDAGLAVEEPARSGPPNAYEGELVFGSMVDGDCVYRLELVEIDSEIVELRWRRHARPPGPQTPRRVGLRDVIGALESYEPACTLTLRALARYRDDPKVRVAKLQKELARMRESPIVLNRKLRQSLLTAVELHGLTLSEIALRCGRIKRDPKGNCSGETSWLGRRVGILPESGTDRPTPWVHSDVLALIAREGLGLSPREVELG